jgi:hypothetical protein
MPDTEWFQYIRWKRQHVELFCLLYHLQVRLIVWSGKGAQQCPDDRSDSLNEALSTLTEG